MSRLDLVRGVVLSALVTVAGGASNWVEIISFD
jgi:hypothetical protein